MHSVPGWQSALDPWGLPGQLPVLDAGSWSVGRRDVEKAAAASWVKGWSGVAETVDVARGQAVESALGW